jgi:dTDP-4-amino-4,6-dideoxygalactose transaminase
MRVPFFDPTRSAAAAAVQGELTEAFLRVLQSGRYILGPEVEHFEAACGELLGAPYTIGVSSCTDALLASMMALDLRPGDEVICPSYTFFSTAGSIARLGGRPVFADIRPGGFTIDPDDVARRITPRTAGIIAVHLFGLPADIASLLDLARRRGLWLIEDCAQAMGAQIGDRRAGTLGALGCFSFFPTKNLGGFGDGGLVATSDPDLARRVRALRSHGAETKNNHQMVGGNFRIDALHAALLRVKLKSFDADLAERRKNAALYDALFSGAGLAGEAPHLPIGLGDRSPGHTFNQYVIRVRGDGARDRLRHSLTERGVGTEIYYPAPLHLQPAFAPLGGSHLPATERAARESLALPIFPGLTEAEIRHVAQTIEELAERSATMGPPR